MIIKRPGNCAHAANGIGAVNQSMNEQAKMDRGWMEGRKGPVAANGRASVRRRTEDLYANIAKQDPGRARQEPE